MAAKRKEMDSAELLKQLRSAIQKQAEEVPEGWKTANQWSDEWGISPNAAGQVLEPRLVVCSKIPSRFADRQRPAESFRTEGCE